MKNRCLRPPLFLLIYLLPATAGLAGLRLPAVFSDHMVIQQGQTVYVWGWGFPGEPVSLTLRGNTATVVASASGRWMTQLEAPPAGGPYQLVVRSSGEQIVVDDILVGEVWLASGQSNMEWSIRASAKAETTLAAADQPLLRLFRVERMTSYEPMENVGGSWTVSTPETARDFSAIAWNFGKEIMETRRVPTGMIQSAWGGTYIEAWMPYPVLSSFSFMEEHLQEMLSQRGEELRRPANQPAVLFNSMIHGLIPYGMRGILWYQGESNAGRSDQYRTLFPAMIQAWRNLWGQDSLAFFHVQLASYRALQSEPVEEGWAYLREAQQAALILPLTGEVVLLDAGDANDIHPADKHTPAHRLAALARAKVYAEAIPHLSPYLIRWTPEGQTLRLEFAPTYGGLRTRDGAPPRGFALQDKDGQWHWAEVTIEPPDTIVLFHPEVPQPRAARYAWANNPIGNLENFAGFPMSGFRTDFPDGR